MVRWLGLLVTLLLWAAPALGAEVRLAVPYQSMELGQVAQIEVQVVNGRVGGLPRLSADDGLRVQFFSQGTSTRRVNFDYTVIRSFSYTVQALREGTFTLGPAAIEVDGKEVTTNSVQIEVKAPPPPLTQDLVAYAGLDTATAWEGQVVLYTYGVRSRSQLLRTNWVRLPVDGLSRPQPPAQQHRQYTVADPTSGTVWVDETVEAFTVTAGSDLDIGIAVARAEVPMADPRGRMSLFPRAEARTASTELISLKVKPLPKAPPGFSGLVGDFTFGSTVATTKAQVGQSVDWRVTVKGDGLVEGVQLPRPSEVDGVRVYEGSPTFNAELTPEGYVGHGLFSRVLVPTKVGHLEVPPLEIITFSPTQGAYVTHQLVVPSIDVRPGKEGTSPDGDLQSFAPDGSEADPTAPAVVDIYPVYESGFDHVPALGAVLPVGTGLLLLFGLGLLSLDAATWWQNRPRRAVAQAVESAASRLAHLPSDPQDRLTALDDALRAAIAQRLGVPESQVDAAQAQASLPQTLAERFTRVLRALNRARFAGEATDQDLVALVRDLVHDLEAA